MTPNTLRRNVIRTAVVVTAVVVFETLAGCSFDLADHPASCESTVDCSDGFFCYETLCVSSGQAGGPAGGNGGSNGDAAVAQDSGGNGGTGGAGGSSADAAAGTDGGGGSSGDAAMNAPDSGSDAASGPVPPYSACAGAGDCNPGETCRMAEGKGVCSAPCSSESDCETPAGMFSADATCGPNDEQCRLDCSLMVGGGPPMQKSCPSGMTCVLEPAMFDWQLGTSTCYP